MWGGIYLRQIALKIVFSVMLTLFDRIQQKLPQAPESVLQQVWTILNAAEDEDLDDEFDRWEAASDEDEAQLAKILTTKGM